MLWPSDAKVTVARVLFYPPLFQAAVFSHFHCQLYTVHSALLIVPALVRLSPCPRIITPTAAATKAGELLQDLTSPGLYFIARCLIHFWKFLPHLIHEDDGWVGGGGEGREITHCLVYFKCFSWCGGGRWLEGDTHLQLSRYRRQEGIIRRGWRKSLRVKVFI